MRHTIKVLAIVAIAASISCRKNDDTINDPSVKESYTSTSDFYVKNGVPLQTYTVSGTTGGSFTTPSGTQIIVPASAFITQSGSAVSGNVTIEFKDIYKKSDMLLSDKGTRLATGGALVSAGEFFIKAIANNSPVQIAPGKKLDIIQPQDTMPQDTVMEAFVGVVDTVIANNQAFVWQPAFNSTVNLYNASSYIFSLYSFSGSPSQGTWCNSDNPYYFSAFPQTALTITTNNSYSEYYTDVFIVFKDVKSMVHVYRSSNTSFPYFGAPQGFECTVVAIGVKDGELYSSFTPITISSNLSVSFSLTKTSTAEFKTKLAQLN